MQITVAGGGYVGLITSACLAELRHSVTLVDIDEKRVEEINSGRTPIYEDGLEDLLVAHVGCDLSACTSYDDVPNSDIFFI